VRRRPGRRRLNRPPEWLHPRFIERRYLEVLNKEVVSKLIMLVNRDILPAVKQLKFQTDQFRPRPQPVRLDDIGDDIRDLISSLTISLGTETTTEQAALEILSTDLSTANREQWDKIIRSTIGVTPFQTEPGLATQKSLFVSQNVGLITKMKADAVLDIQGVIERGLQQGLRVEEITKQIREKTNATANKAKLIARDQVAKANAQLTKDRQEGVGVQRYIWRTSRDERVRGKASGKYPDAIPKHSVMEGKTCLWSDPTVWIDQNGKRRKRSTIKGPDEHPGVPINCRCTAEPVLEDILGPGF
jgi:SPP1 gp7 family putative phage head morphogenesis protein